jgi:hypothetical protein
MAPAAAVAGGGGGGVKRVKRPTNQRSAIHFDPFELGEADEDLAQANRLAGLYAQHPCRDPPPGEITICH